MAFALRKQGFDQQPTGKKSKPVKDKDYLSFLHNLPCIVTGRTPVEAAHISYAEPKYGKLGRGKASKESDLWAVPLHKSEHDRQHSMNERAYWRSVGIDPCVVALSLYVACPDVERGELIIRNIERRILTLDAGNAEDFE